MHVIHTHTINTDKSCLHLYLNSFLEGQLIRAKLYILNYMNTIPFPPSSKYKFLSTSTSAYSRKISSLLSLLPTSKYVVWCCKQLGNLWKMLSTKLLLKSVKAKSSLMHSSTTCRLLRRQLVFNNSK